MSWLSSAGGSSLRISPTVSITVTGAPIADRPFIASVSSLAHVKMVVVPSGEPTLQISTGITDPGAGGSIPMNVKRNVRNGH